MAHDLTKGKFNYKFSSNMEPRKKIVHYNLPHYAHSLTFSCYHHRPYFSKDRTCLWFVEALDQARNSLSYGLWAYVIMPEHVHLIVWPTLEKYDISEFLKSIKQSVSRKARLFLKRNNPIAINNMTVKQKDREVFRFWQAGPGYDLNLYRDDTLMEKIEYIHNNPVRRGLVKSTVEYPWSSARWYAGEKDAPLKMDPLVL
jgi:putative transposase